MTAARLSCSNDAHVVSESTHRDRSDPRVTMTLFQQVTASDGKGGPHPQRMMWICSELFTDSLLVSPGGAICQLSYLMMRRQGSEVFGVTEIVRSTPGSIIQRSR